MINLGGDVLKRATPCEDISEFLDRIRLGICLELALSVSKTKKVRFFGVKLDLTMDARIDRPIKVNLT
jgi:hypothetical protein